MTIETVRTVSRAYDKAVRTADLSPVEALDVLLAELEAVLPQPCGNCGSTDNNGFDCFSCGASDEDET